MVRSSRWLTSVVLSLAVKTDGCFARGKKFGRASCPPAQPTDRRRVLSAEPLLPLASWRRPPAALRTAEESVAGCFEFVAAALGSASAAFCLPSDPGGHPLADSASPRLTFSDMFIRPVLRWWDRTFPLVLGDTDIFLRPESLHVRLVPERLVR